MRVAPEASEASREREGAASILSAVLDRVTAQLLDDGIPVIDIPSRALTYPGLFAAAYAAQAALRAGRPPLETRRALASRLGDAVRRADESAARRGASGSAVWPVDLAPPEEHLVASLARAVSQVPQRPDRLEALAALQVGAWDDEDRAVFAAATDLLERTWPEMLAELRIVVVQIALLRGFGIDGFTDVATHGAIYVNGARLRPGVESGLDGSVRLAEALVHEAAHNRCNAAALSTPFLADAGPGDEPVLQTPLRQDPRPLTGLLQQLVVLVRSAMLYDRLLDAGMAQQALVDRREKLRGQASEALRVISGHTGRLTDHGRSVVAEARDLHARSPAVAAPAAT